MVAESGEARLAGEGRASDAAHREAFAPVIGHQGCEIRLLVVDLVGADRLAINGVVGGESELGHGAGRALHKRGRECTLSVATGLMGPGSE